MLRRSSLYDLHAIDHSFTRFLRVLGPCLLPSANHRPVGQVTFSLLFRSYPPFLVEQHCKDMAIAPAAGAAPTELAHVRYFIDASIAEDVKRKVRRIKRDEKSFADLGTAHRPATRLLRSSMPSAIAFFARTRCWPIFTHCYISSSIEQLRY